MIRRAWDIVMGRQRGLIAGSSINMFFSVANYGIRFAVSVLVARSLGVQGKGIFALVLMTGGLLTLLLNPGLSSAITYLSASRKFEPKELFGFGLWANLISNLVGGILFFILYLVLLKDNLLSGVSTFQIGLILISSPIVLLTQQTNGLLLGNQQILAVNSIELTRSISNIILQIAVWYADLGINGAIIAWLGANFIAMTAGLWIGSQNLSVKLVKIREIFREVASYGSKSYISNTLSFFNYRLDSYLVNLFLGHGQVGLYATGVGVAELLWYVPNAVGGALFPKVSTLENQTASLVTARTCRLVFLTTVGGAFFLGGIGQPLIVLAYGPDFEPASAPLLWLLPGISGMAVTKIISANLSGRGKPEYATRTTILMLLITVLADLVLIPNYGIVGAAAASSFAYIMGGLFSLVWFSRESGLPWHNALIPHASDVQIVIQRLAVLTKRNSKSE